MVGMMQVLNKRQVGLVHSDYRIAQALEAVNDTFALFAQDVHVGFEGEFSVKIEA
jgi:hypothetical protein